MSKEIEIDGTAYRIVESEREVSDCRKCDHFSVCNGLCPIRAYKTDWRGYVLSK